MLRNILRKIQYIDPSSANCYHINNDVQFNLGKKFIDDNGSLIKGNVLDIGSGDGKVTSYIASKISQPILGVDISSDRVKFANDTYGTNKIKFVIGNACKLDEQPDVSSNQYGTIVSFCTLHHLPKSMQSAVFSQTKKLLAEDGVALFLIPGRSPELHDAINEVTASANWQTYFVNFNLSNVRTYETPEYYKTMSITSGFYRCEAVSACEDGGKELDFEGMKDFISGWLPHLAHLKSKNIDQSKQDEFLNDTVKLYYFKINKGIQEKVTPNIMQNKIINYATELSFFRRSNIEQQMHQPSASIEALRKRI